MTEYSYTTLDLAKKAAALEEANNTKEAQEVWLEMAEQLQVDGVPRNQISRTIIKLVEKELNKGQDKDTPKIKFQSSWFWEVMRTNGLTAGEAGKRYGTIVPSDKKEHKNNVELSNKLLEVGALCTRLAQRVLHMPALEDHLDKKNLNEFYKQFDKIIESSGTAFDPRVKITEDIQHTLLEMMSTETSLARAAEKTLEARIRLLQETGDWLTQKQAAKIKKGGPEQTLPIIHPHTRDWAIFLGYYGQQCVECDSWRLRVQDGSRHNLYCLDCGLEVKARTLPHCTSCGKLLEKKYKNCPGCGVPLDMPDGKE